VQWVSDVANRINAPFTVLEKERHGDRDVAVRVQDAPRLSGRMPVLLDDIISSGQTMLQAVKLLRTLSSSPPACIAVHGLFADRSDVLLQQEGARLVTSNTLPHPSNAMDVSAILADAIAQIANAII
jgi:ribose-phosphate pyrophosphokinase